MEVEGKMSPIMDEFVAKVDRLCFEYKCEIFPYTMEDGRTVLRVSREEETALLLYIDGDGRGE